MLTAAWACVLAGPIASSWATQRLDLDITSADWEHKAEGPYSIRTDRRGVLTMSHADSPAAAGDQAAIGRTLDLPEGEPGPLVLRFYLSDDYCGDRQQAVHSSDSAREPTEDWKEGVRFCEVVLEDVAVWSQDVVGRTGTTAGSRFFDLDIGELVKGKRSVDLDLRVRDAEGTGDAPFPGEVFWARAELLWDFGKEPPPVEFPPRLVIRRERFLRPEPPPPSGVTQITVRNPSGVALEACPVRSGMPLPQGAVTRATQVGLEDAAGRPVPLQARVTTRWPDGTAKWVLMDFTTPLGPGDTAFRLRYGAESPHPPARDRPPVTIQEPPPVVVFEPGWLAATGVLGPFHERDERRFPELEGPARRLREDLADWESADCDRAHLLLSEYLRTGDPELFYVGGRAAAEYREAGVTQWTEGLFDHWLLTGDERSLECAKLAADHARRAALTTTHGGEERGAGLNLLSLMGAYRATGDASFLEAARKKVEDVLAHLDPVRGVSSAPLHERSAYEGGTPSAAAILMRGLTAYYDETRDERVGWAVCGLCDWMACEMMPEPGRFCHTQAPSLRGAAPLLSALDGAAFAWCFAGDPFYRQLARDVYREAAVGAGLADTRDVPHALALYATALPPVALESVRAPLLIARGAGASATFALRNLSGQDETVLLRLAGTGQADPASTDVPAAGATAAAEVPLAVPGEPGALRAAYEVVCRDEVVAAGEIASLVLPEVPRVLLLAGPDSLTTRSLERLGLPLRRADMQQFVPALLAGTDVLVCGHDSDRAPLEAHAQALQEWVKGGGVVLGFRDNSGHNGWLPSPIGQGASHESGEVLRPEAGAFHLLHEITSERLRAVHGGSAEAAFCDLGPGWEPLASAGNRPEPQGGRPHYGLVELRLGRGRILLCQLVPECAWLNDDAGAERSPGRELLANLLAYVCVAAG